MEVLRQAYNERSEVRGQNSELKIILNSSFYILSFRLRQGYAGQAVFCFLSRHRRVNFCFGVWPKHTVNWLNGYWLNKFKNQSVKCKIEEVIQHLIFLSAEFHNFDFLFLIFNFFVLPITNV